MAKKVSTSSSSATAAAVKTPDHSSSAPVAHSSTSYQKLSCDLYRNYIASSSKRVKLIDSFLVFLVFLGIFQFAFCAVVGTFPFNAFLGGFGATVGQFVLLASLRIQISEENYGQFKAVSPER